jgi:flagellar biosynthesis protein FlhF
MTPPHKYYAASIEEATALIRNSLGSDALIISTDRVKGKDGRTFFEISAVPGNASHEQGPSGVLDQIKDELVRLQQMMVNTSPLSFSHLIKHPGLMPLCSRMVSQGIEESVIKKILENAGVLSGRSDLSTADARNRIIRTLMQMLHVTDPFSNTGDRQQIAAFVGTTGVGKTTTIAKIAATLLMQHKKSVGLVSIDTYRIGAMEQLKNYADILGIPCFQAFTPKDLLLALERLQSRQVVLIDTAGRSQYDMTRLEGLKTMIGKDAAIDIHLLLNVGAAPPEMNETVKSFCPLAFKTYIFTKLDETRMMGNIVNQVVKHGAPISYLTAGQQVPEDIEPADVKKIMTRLLGKKQNNAITIGD